jgi:hypothetical protein
MVLYNIFSTFSSEMNSYKGIYEVVDSNGQKIDIGTDVVRVETSFNYCCCIPSSEHHYLVNGTLYKGEFVTKDVPGKAISTVDVGCCELNRITMTNCCCCCIPKFAGNFLSIVESVALILIAVGGVRVRRVKFCCKDRCRTCMPDDHTSCMWCKLCFCCRSYGSRTYRYVEIKEAQGDMCIVVNNRESTGQETQEMTRI